MLQDVVNQEPEVLLRKAYRSSKPCARTEHALEHAFRRKVYPFHKEEVGTEVAHDNVKPSNHQTVLTGLPLDRSWAQRAPRRLANHQFQPG